MQPHHVNCLATYASKSADPPTLRDPFSQADDPPRLNDKIHQGTLQHLDVGICGPSTTKQFGPLMIRVTVDPGDDEIAFGTVPAA